MRYYLFYENLQTQSSSARKSFCNLGHWHDVRVDHGRLINRIGKFSHYVLQYRKELYEGALKPRENVWHDDFENYKTNSQTNCVKNFHKENFEGA